MKQRSCKRIAASLAALLLLGGGLAGCGDTPSAPTDSSSSQPSASASSETPSSGAPQEITEISWYISQDATQPDEAKVFEELNKYTEEKIGVHVNQVIYKNADYNEKVPVMINSGAKFDICFTAGWGNKFLPNVERGAYADITDLVKEYAKETYEAIPQMVWDAAATVNGKIYAIPAYKEIGAQPGLMINSDLAEQVGIEYPKEVKSLADWEPVLAQVKEKLPGVIPLGSISFNIVMPFQVLGNTIATAAVPGFTEFSDQGDKVFNIYETKDFEDYCNLMYGWKQKGYLPDDPVTYDTDAAGRDRDDQANKLFSWVISYAPGYKDTRAATIGHGVDYVPLRDPVYAGGGGMMAISSLSENKEKSLEFLNLVNTDEYVGTLIRHGVKDVHYSEVDVDGVTMLDPYGTGYTAETHPYNIPYGWQFGSVFNQKWVNSYASDIVAQFESYNAGAKLVPYLGFTPDTTSISAEIAALSNVVAEYEAPLTKGMSDPATGIPKFRQALRDSGADKVIAEIQSQIDTFKTK